MKTMRALITVMLFAIPLFAQEKERPRIFVTDSQSWEISGGFGGGGDAVAGSQSGGARPQTAEVIKTFGERCKDCVVTIKKEKADYIVILEHEGGKEFFRKDNKFAIFNKNGDAIGSGSTRTLGNSVKEACDSMMKDWASSQGKKAEPKPDSKS
ncbi:MAG: hypothetical protein DMF61_16170 [Blastocatellia bacterium AA13]|nr:MAG: hypothetical protein DMF61_16170 [Blastocatellia bacterium AA13]